MYKRQDLYTGRTNCRAPSQRYGGTPGNTKMCIRDRDKMKQYDVIIIGAGPSGIFCAYELKRQKPDLSVLMVEKGRCIEERQCPKRKTKVCVGCKPCSITTGFAGAGAFSDGKLSLSPDVGGTRCV